MKTLLMVLSGTLFTVAAFAQDETRPGHPHDDKSNKQQHQQDGKTMREYYMYRDGRVWHYRGDTASAAPITRNITLKNGAVITTKGEVIPKNGKRQMLSNGQCVDMLANINNCENMYPMKRDEPAHKQPDQNNNNKY